MYVLTEPGRKPRVILTHAEKLQRKAQVDLLVEQVLMRAEEFAPRSYTRSPQAVKLARRSVMRELDRLVLEKVAK